jgi:hypothetical protein
VYLVVDHRILEAKALGYSREQQRMIERSHVSDIIQGVAVRDARIVYEVPKVKTYCKEVNRSILIIDELF